MPGALILINGFPGIGKHAVAYELVKLLPNCRFFDTRNVITAASQLYDSDDPAHAVLRKNLKHAIFQSIATHYADVSPTAPPPPTYVLTDFLSVSARAIDLAIMKEFIHFAQTSGFAFIHVILSASTEANVARCMSAERQAASRPTTEASLLQTRMEEEIGHIAPVRGLSGEYELDTTRMDARTTAGVLAEYCLDTLRHQGWWIQLAGHTRKGTVCATSPAPRR
ncbi:uncharacterized protein LOC62_06G008154 [Vanrija pseudolonga]|uniref:Uncharacterized protein n=1 Tax=Vanrija pseudolonga TaxID=143232 RepID=A0AAF0YD94_9TREE|nr:hypothetical protein LOC62_06G008154 [Vanrija pseudolonga]